MTESSEGSALASQEDQDGLEQRGNEWTSLLIQSNREAARWNLATGGAVLALSGAASQFSPGDATRLVAAAGLVAALVAFAMVILHWWKVVEPRDAERETAPYLSGVERDMLPPLRSQTMWLAVEFIVLAITLAAALVVSAFSEEGEDDDIRGSGSAPAGSVVAANA